MVFNEGHDRAVDLWAAGVLLFEMALAYTPFSKLAHTTLKVDGTAPAGVTDANSRDEKLKPVTDLLTNIAFVKVGLSAQ